MRVSAREEIVRSPIVVWFFFLFPFPGHVILSNQNAAFGRQRRSAGHDASSSTHRRPLRASRDDIRRARDRAAGRAHRTRACIPRPHRYGASCVVHVRSEVARRRRPSGARGHRTLVVVVVVVVGSDATGVSRRAALAGKALFTLGEAFIFPWATEGATRPKSPATADLAPFSPAWLSSILYTETNPDAKASAKAALLLGEALQAEGKHAEAIGKFEEVYALAPTEYKMCQRAGLLTAVSYKAMSTRLGDDYDKKANDAKQVVWWWGRGHAVAGVVHRGVPVRPERLVRNEGGPGRGVHRDGGAGGAGADMARTPVRSRHVRHPGLLIPITDDDDRNPLFRRRSRRDDSLAVLVVS